MIIVLINRWVSYSNRFSHFCIFFFWLCESISVFQQLQVRGLPSMGAFCQSYLAWILQALVAKGFIMLWRTHTFLAWIVRIRVLHRYLPHFIFEIGLDSGIFIEAFNLPLLALFDEALLALFDEALWLCWHCLMKLCGFHTLIALSLMSYMLVAWSLDSCTERIRSWRGVRTCCKPSLWYQWNCREKKWSANLSGTHSCVELCLLHIKCWYSYNQSLGRGFFFFLFPPYWKLCVWFFIGWKAFKKSTGKIWD